MRNIKLILEYDGTAYSGWQSQTNALAIQDVVKQAIRKMMEEEIILEGASRTDAGVHALGQVAAFKTSRTIPCDGFLKGLNNLLPEDIRIVGCEEAPKNFHPTIDAKRKTYQYRLGVAEVPSALERNRAWWLQPPLDVKAMEEASQCLIGEHDFKSFQGANSTAKTTVRKLESIEFLPWNMAHGTWNMEHGTSHNLTFTGTGFLKYMIRNIVGTLVYVGTGKLKPDDVKKILEARDRTRAGICAPPQGLYLVKVEY